MYMYFFLLCDKQTSRAREEAVLLDMTYKSIRGLTRIWYKSWYKSLNYRITYLQIHFCTLCALFAESLSLFLFFSLFSLSLSLFLSISNDKEAERYFAA